MDAGTWIEAWERARVTPPVLRSVVLLSQHSGTGVEVLARLPIGARDRLLLAMRDSLFGRSLDAVATCATCGVDVEFTLDARSIAVNTPPCQDATFAVRCEDYDVEARLVDSLDLAAAARAHSVDDARAVLIARVVASIRHRGESATTDQLPEQAMLAMDRALAAKDPDAVIEIELACPECSSRWASVFDIAAFVWHEVDRWAEHTLDDVHALASAYGWSEASILALPPSRRARYLASIRAEA